MAWLKLSGVALSLLASTTFLHPPRAQRSALEAKQWTIGSAKRTALVAMPKVFPASGAPLVLVFHGHGGTAPNMTRAMPIHSEWPEAIVIYPQGLPSPGSIGDREGRNAGWQSSPGSLNDRDVKFVDSLLVWAKATYRVDTNRVFATGHSNGGWFTYVLWTMRPNQFAAFAPAAAVFGRMAQEARPKSAMIIAGANDRLVAFGLQRRTIDAVLRLNQADTAGLPWAGAAKLHKSRLAETVVYVYPGAHPLPADAAMLVAKFFKER
jgi:polyhydroxybutyrate depolymerase